MTPRDVSRGLIVAVLRELERVAAGGETVDVEVRFHVRGGSVRPEVGFAERRNVRRLRSGSDRDSIRSGE